MTELTLELRQRQSLSQQAIQKIELLQMNTAQLDDFLENIFIENPLVDMDASYTKEDCPTLDFISGSDLSENENQSHSSTAIDPIAHYARQEALSISQQIYMQLLPHIHTLQDQNILHYLVDSLDERGYLTVSSEDLCFCFHISPACAQKYIERLYELEPAGIGARNLQECLLLQLTRKKHPHKDLARQLITHHLQDIAAGRIKQLCGLLKVKEADLQQAIDFIRSLNPKPLNGADFADKVPCIRPDIIISESENGYTITLTKGSISRLYANQDYLELLKHTSDSEKEYLKVKYQNMMWINHCLESRETTLTQVARMILIHQKDFFKNGPAQLHAYEQAALAKQLSLNDSTISRAVHDKYLQCRWGVFPLKYFFPRSLSGAGDSITTDQFKAHIQSLIEKEDKHHPLSDQKIAVLLQKENFHLSRRTIAKYRAEMNIPDTSRRRQS